MGEVYAGFDDTLHRRVALKAIREDHRLSAPAKARFLREARILSQLDHPGICRVYDFIETPASDWLVLELIEGKTLDAALRRGIEPALRLAIAQQIADVLVVTHRAGVVHRDLKPGNVMLTGGDAVKVLDFGLAQAGEINFDMPRANAPGAIVSHDIDATRTLAAGHHTHADVIIGSPGYMSPEQTRGEPATPASDVFSFGLVLQELFTGGTAYRHDVPLATLLDDMRRGATKPIAGAPADIAGLITAMTSPLAAGRPTAVEVASRIRWIRDKPKRRLRNLAVAALAVAAFGGATKYTIDLARERTIAVVARDDAERRRAQAEDLIGFMLGDLREKLEPVGRLDVLDGVGAKAMDYFASVPASALSDAELLSRSTALYQIGEVRIAQGNLPAAAQPLQESLTLAEALVARSPGDGNRLFNLAQSHYWVGFVHWRRHELDAAETQFQAYLDVARRLVALDGTKADWRREMAYASSNIGSVLQARGDLEGALEKFRETLAIEESLLADSPEDAELAEAVAASHNAIGLVLRLRGTIDAAVEEFAKEQSVLSGLLEKAPGNAALSHYLAVSHIYVGDLLAARGRLRDARAAYGRALDIATALTRRDPSNSVWRRLLARGQVVAGVAHLPDDAPGAFVSVDKAVSALRTLTTSDPTNAGWQRDMAEAFFARGLALMARGSLDAAAIDASASLRGCGELLEASPDDREAARIASQAHGLHARIWEARGNAARARLSWGASLAMIAPVAAGSDDYQFLEPLAFALIETGRASEALPVIQKLDAMQYHNTRLFAAANRAGLRLQARPDPNEGRED